MEGDVLTPRRVGRLLPALIAACCCAWNGGAAHAQNPNVARGWNPAGMFDVGGLDSVSGFNGNLVITIPIGQGYPVGGPMGSYSFSLVYNSNVWSYLQDPNTNAVHAISDPVANAGLGWSFSLGRIATDFGIPGFEGLVNGETEDYFGADGSAHFLFAQQGDPALYTQDGSFLRFRSDAQELDFADGSRHTFGGDGLPISIVDSFGNGLTISYVKFAAPNGDLASEWDIQDSTGRIHKAYFRLTGYTAPEQRAVLDHIDLQAVGGNLATYTFLYNGQAQPGDPLPEVRMTGHGTTGDPSWNPRVALLTKLLLPDVNHNNVRSSYSMPVASYQGPSSAPAGYPGPINQMSLPTSGSIRWAYGVTSLPQPNVSKPWLNAIWQQVAGVSQRSLYSEPNGQSLVGVWKYTSTFDRVNDPNEVVRSVIYPPADPNADPSSDGHFVKTYYSACVHATCDGATPTYGVEYGLPLSRVQPSDGAGRYLSQEIFEQGAASPVRRIYVAYDSDGNPNQSDEPIYANQRLQSRRTFFLDDALPTTGSGSGGCAANSNACTSVTTDFSDYDGLGHYRLATTSDTFGLGTPRLERTEWNQFQAGRPPASQPWVLDTFTFMQQQEGSGIERQEAVFEPGTGFLTCLRRLKTATAPGQSGTTRGIHDVLVSYAHDAQGNVTLESWFGGDTARIGTTGTCADGLTATYTYTHVTTGGVRSSTTVTVPSSPNPLSLLDLTIDSGTGLASSSTDASGRPTSFSYDLLGRLVTTSPRGDATTAVSYQMSDTAPPSLTRTVGGGLEQESWSYDGLGRMVQDAVSLPGGTAATTTAYNGLGWKTFVSAPGKGSGIGTFFKGLDAFGRPTSITTTGVSKPIYLGYAGARIATRTQWVQQRTQQTDANGHLVYVVSELPAITQETYDGLGRLRQVKDANGALTHYDYDVGGRLDAVLAASGSARQVRSFLYDGRGFLVRAVSAEGGATSYRYDARGNVTQQSDATGTIFETYDPAGRPLEVDSTASGSAVRLKKLEYDNAANGTGKLATAHAYNYRSADSCAAPYEVRQDMAYDPSHGRLSQETTTLLHGSSLESWVQSYVYDGAGRITTTTYPTCQALCTAPSRGATTVYGFGRPVSVSGFASSITYNSNGTLATVAHLNGVTFAELPDPNGIPRPASLGVQTPPAVWPLEAYSYDGSGNVTQIGSKSFTYDPDSRLLSATQPAASPQPYQELTYDALGNLVNVASGTAPGNVPSSVAYTTDAATNHLTAASYDGSGTLHNFQLSTYLWDRFQQLTDVTTPAETWVHVYDAAGERVWSWRTSPSRLDNYALRGQDGHVLSLFTKTGSTYTWEDYVYREGQLLGAQASSGAVTHFDVDHLGSLRLESDQPGQHFTYHEYWPYGEEFTGTTSTERMRFTGQERDLVNDIDSMHARSYKPLFGRFLSPDPVAGDPSEPRSFNLYGYVRGQPLNATDPAGLWTYLTFGGALDFFFADSITVTGAAWQFAPGPDTGMWGLTALQVGSLQIQNVGDPDVELSLVDRVLSAIPIQSNKYGECVRKHRADPADAVVALGSAVPKALVPPFRVIGNRLTTLPSVGAFAINSTLGGSEAASAVAAGLRGAGRVISPVATPLTIAEGAWDWGALIYCAGAGD
jgi:RHS repeat-associated protein